MTDRLDEFGWGDAGERDRWHGVIGDLLCVGTGLAIASLCAVSGLACLFLPGRRADDSVQPPVGDGSSPGVR
jgi:hypothetical protein